MEALHPYVPIGDSVRISIAIVSYLDTVSLGVTADHNAVPDIEVLIEGIGHGLAELVGPRPAEGTPPCCPARPAPQVEVACEVQRANYSIHNGMIRAARLLVAGRPAGRMEVVVGAVLGGRGAAARQARPRTGLVLGAGGVLGAAWMTGALPAVQDRLPCAVGDVDVIIGTSAGSVLGAALRCGAGPSDLIAHQQGQAAGALGELGLPLPQNGPLPPLPHWRAGSPRLMCHALLAPHRVPPWVGATA
jgi:hypothetical protein